MINFWYAKNVLHGNVVENVFRHSEKEACDVAVGSEVGRMGLDGVGLVVAWG